MFRKNRTALVLGCGPAGLIALHALRMEFDMEFFIVSKKRKSDLFGCQYLHEPIPMLGESWDLDETSQRMVDYRLIGTAEEYAKKVYGDNPPKNVSPQILVGQHPAWDIRKTYDALWEKYERRIIDFEFEPGDNLQGMIESMVRFYEPDFVVSSIPAPVLCLQPDKHTFEAVPIWAIGDAPDIQNVPRLAPDNTVICDGTKDHGYYRVSNVFGYSTIEWPGDRKPPMEGVVQVNKPIGTNCDCWAGIHRVGRMGTWTKGVLAHHVYGSTKNWVQAQLDRPKEGENHDERLPQ